MGAGQIGGIATLLDIDFNNAAGFVGVPAERTEAHFVVYYLSHAMMFCTGALIEAHVVITAANCVVGERFKFDVYGGTHTFVEHSGNAKQVQHMATHRAYNHTNRWEYCSPHNLALLLLDEQYLFHKREPSTEFIVSRVRYGSLPHKEDDQEMLRLAKTCQFFGWGSRRNGYLVPLLVRLRRVDVRIMDRHDCQQMWNYDNKYLCLSRLPCKSEKFGALCPDDMGSVLVCAGYLRGLMTSRLMDRPCGVGFLDLNHYQKFISCGVDDARDVLGHDDLKGVEFADVLNTKPHTWMTAKPDPTTETIKLETFAPEPEGNDDEEEVEAPAPAPAPIDAHNIEIVGGDENKGVDDFLSFQKEEEKVGRYNNF